MNSIGCGCKICKAGLSDTVNEMIQGQIEPFAVLKFLENKGCKVSDKLLKKHLSAFTIPYPEVDVNDFKTVLEPVPNNLVDIDFSQYKVDLSNTEVTLELLQKITLKVFLNQARITIQAQQKMLDGLSPDMPKDTMRNYATALDMLDKTSAISMMVNQQQAIKTVEAMGLTIQSSAIQNVQD
ncbi:hypothetical protein QUB70_28190 [Microcoleus sp. A003_D6]|uniref:hypothetical protein n=1 Tax=Microcoleus sp. A003_D6 TaxID=3055266 RepID=UPI002FD6C7EB